MKSLHQLLSDPRVQAAIAAFRQQAKQVIDDVSELVRKKPKLSVGIGVAIVLGVWLVYFSTPAGMPQVEKKSRSLLPTSVEKATLEVFESRFVRLGDSHFSIVVHYTPNVMKELGKMPFLGGTPDAKSPQAPVVTHMELVEIKGLRTEVSVETLKPSDHLNDIKWKGTLSVRGEVERRRSLKLTDWLREVVEKEAKTPVPWFEQSVTLENLNDSQPNQALPFGDMMGQMMQLFTGDLSGEITRFIEGGDWGDWVECGNACYQSSHATVRGREVKVVTTESPEAAFVEGPEITLLALYTKNFFQIQALIENGAEMAFLMKPNLSALRNADLLK